MNIDIMKVSALVASLIGIYKVVSELSNGKKKMLWEEYKYVQEIMAEYSKDRNLHPYIIEKAFHAITGSPRLNAQEICYILSLEKPLKILHKYMHGKRYLKYDSASGLIRFREQYASKNKVLFLKTTLFAMYFFFASLSLGPLIFLTPLANDIPSLIVNMGSFGLIAGLALREHVNLHRAVDVIKAQDQLKQ